MKFNKLVVPIALALTPFAQAKELNSIGVNGGRFSQSVLCTNC